jgi:hypothetical protein
MTGCTGGGVSFKLAQWRAQSFRAEQGGGTSGLQQSSLWLKPADGSKSLSATISVQSWLGLANFPINRIAELTPPLVGPKLTAEIRRRHQPWVAKTDTLQQPTRY